MKTEKLTPRQNAAVVVCIAGAVFMLIGNAPFAIGLFLYELSIWLVSREP